MIQPPYAPAQAPRQHGIEEGGGDHHAPSSSATTHHREHRTPPQPIGCCQPTKVNQPRMAGGQPWHQTEAGPSTPARSRITPSVTARHTRLAACGAENVAEYAGIRDPHRIDDRDAALRHRLDRRPVEVGEAHDAGVARSSRRGRKRSVKAGPTTRWLAFPSGLVPRIQTFRSPIFRRTVVRSPSRHVLEVATSSAG
jgi:hypothetical protein